jgi:2-amino-4-hydroxy-6-hydroxymethyldihydropteridine diphosphokinase
MAMHILFLSFGSNLGDKERNICAAYDKIEGRIGKIISKSAFYVTEPDGFHSENFFLNSVCQVETKLGVYEVFDLIKVLELELGRSSKSQRGVYADRLIDIDLLMYDDLIIDEPALTIPHPRFHLRDFVLLPFAEIAPEVIHPLLLKTTEELKDEFYRA